MRLLLCVLGIALAACGPGPAPAKAQIRVDRSDAGVQFPATPVGEVADQSLEVQNTGLEPLTITGVSISGDKEFTLSGPKPAGGTAYRTPWDIIDLEFTDAGPPKTGVAVVKAQQSTFLHVIFTPTAYRPYTASVAIQSNAGNAPQLLVLIAGSGIDGGP